MNANYGIFVCDKDIPDKRLRKEYFLTRSMEEIKKYMEDWYGKFV